MSRRPTEEAYLAARMLELLTKIAVSRRKCHYCPAMLYFVQHRDGGIGAYTEDGTNHWANCMNAEAARRERDSKRKKGQQQLIETSPTP